MSFDRGGMSSSLSSAPRSGRPSGTTSWRMPLRHRRHAPDPTQPASEPVASLEMIQLGGVDQWVLIRGRDSSNPVLLWLHGGPGSAQMPVRAVTSELEEWFVVVHWDPAGRRQVQQPAVRRIHDVRATVRR